MPNSIYMNVILPQWIREYEKEINFSDSESYGMEAMRREIEKFRGWEDEIWKFFSKSFPILFNPNFKSFL
jgi:hypothetical protein